MIATGIEGPDNAPRRRSVEDWNRPSRMQSWYAVLPPGLEAVGARELRAHAVTDLSVLPGGVRFRAPLEQGARLAALLRTPGRLLLELATGSAPTLEALAGLVRRTDWRPYLTPWTPLEIQVSAKESRVRYRDTAGAKVEHAIRDALRGPRVAGLRPKWDPPSQRVMVRLEHDQATLSLDVGGELLHLRGWRKISGRAPIRENLASCLLGIAGWDGSEPLLDPFCGSGTIPIEAWLQAAGRPPWVQRTFAFASWPAMEKVRLPDPRRGHPVEVEIWGADKESQALAAAHENAALAGVHPRWMQCDVADLEPPCPTGLILTNPPYGERLGQRVDGVYATFGRTLRERFAGWRALYLAPNRGLAQMVDREARELTTFSNGGIRVGVYGLTLG